MRKTREQYALEKKENASTFPVVLAGINFQGEGNLGFLVRAAACFGADKVLIVGAIPPARKLRQYSAGLSKHIEIIQFSNPGQLLAYCRALDYQIVSLELTEEATSIYDYQYDFDRPTCIVAGHETIGVPNEILFNSDVVYIPMPGVGRCLNTSQAANVALYEYVKQYHQRE
jgi:tRNA G18 (ribose-2'-O)-methylase SpoU